MDDSWKYYEEVATYLLNRCSEEFGLQRVEPKQKVKGNRSGTDWEIDAKGICNDDEGFIIIECRKNKKSKQNQEKIGGLAYRILDTGASGGILVSPIGFQKGAKKIAAAENIIHVLLSPDSTPQEFYMKFLNKVFIGLSCGTEIGVSISAKVTRICKICGTRFERIENERKCPDCSQTSQ